MNYLLIDDNSWHDLLPITFTRPVSEIRVGILTIKEKWQYFLPTATISYVTEPYLQKKYPSKLATINYWINSSILPNHIVVDQIHELPEESYLVDKEGKIMAVYGANNRIDEKKKYIYEQDYASIRQLWDIFNQNDAQIRQDFVHITKNRESATWDTTNTILGSNIFLEPDAILQACTINTTTGPVYIGKKAEIMEGSLVRGSLALCDGSTLKMGAKIYGGTTIGPNSKVGGEVSNVVFLGNSNKAHDGFLGNSVIGEWCNLGADTNNSNLKNNYATVKLWNYSKNSFVATGLQFCGLVMADHSKAAINSMFNTGTVVGVCCNIFGAGFPRNFIPSYTWGTTRYDLEKSYETIEKVYERRNKLLSNEEKDILKYIFDYENAGV